MTGQVTKTTHRTDAEIFAEARSGLDRRPNVPDTVRVHVDQGVVTLTGTVRLGSQQAEAEDTVRHLSGTATAAGESPRERLWRIVAAIPSV